MSAGIFTRSSYEADSGEIHPIRVQPETIGTANAAPAGTITSGISARVGGSRRSLGLHARGIRLAFPETGAPAGYKAGGTTFIPILTPAAFTPLQKNATFTYLGVACTILSKVPEVEK